MKTTIPATKEIEVAFVRLELAVRYDEEDIPNDFPLRTGDLWKATVVIDTGLILGWPAGRSGRVQMKVCDSGCYTLLDVDKKEIASIDGDYVPHGLVPGECGDYVDLQINDQGVITNWPKEPDLDAFFRKSED